MRKLILVLSLGLLVAAGTTTPRASSHREAPLISQDPLADNTDTYAFVSPASPDKVVLIANYIPLEAPYGGPNFFKFDDNVLYDRALFAFPRHPYALAGQARVAAIRGDLPQALRGYRDLLAQAPTPELAAHVGDLLFRRGDLEGASSQWAYAERLKREGWKDEAPQPGALARLLTERDLQPQEALRLAREAAAGRDDIFTNDTLAWALYRTGAFAQAWAASERARRTGTCDRRILYHAAAIAAARGDRAGASRLAVRALEGHPEFDVIAAPAAKALLASLAS